MGLWYSLVTGYSVLVKLQISITNNNIRSLNKFKVSKDLLERSSTTDFKHFAEIVWEQQDK